MDSITFDREWQRVAVDKAPMPSDQLASILDHVELGNLWMAGRDMFEAKPEVNEIILKHSNGNRYRLGRPRR